MSHEDPGNDTNVRLSPPPRVRPIRPAPREASAAGPPKDARPSVRRRGVWVAAAILAPLSLLAALVLAVLPGWVQRDTGPDAPPEASTEPAPIVEPVPDDDDAREAAGRFLERASTLSAQLEQRRAFVWAAEDLAEARERMDEGDRLLALGAHAEATEAYREAIERFEAIVAAGGKRVREAVAQGQAALEAADVAAATEAFTRATTIAPGNEAARKGLERTRLLDRVLARLDEGRRLEQDGRLAEAERSLQSALEMDPSSAAARAELDRVRAAIRDDAFASAMAEGLRALDAGDHEAARAAFQRADGLRPGAPEVAEALLRVEQAASTEKISEHLDRAQAAERREDWHAAASEYAAVLAIDPSIAPAREGRERASERADLSDRLDYHLANPERLSADEAFEEARELLARAREVAPAGPQHRRRVDALTGLLEEAGTPVPVVLLSDGLTEVTVYRVGRLGTFERRELELRPGTYTVVGTRAGFRDYRTALVVEAGASPPTLSVSCRDPI